MAQETGDVYKHYLQDQAFAWICMQGEESELLRLLRKPHAVKWHEMYTISLVARAIDNMHLTHLSNFQARYDVCFASPLGSCASCPRHPEPRRVVVGQAKARHS